MACSRYHTDSKIIKKKNDEKDKIHSNGIRSSLLGFLYG